jgi:tetratricopeptide (TPR) repeat protein
VHERIGDVQQAQGDLAAALGSYRASLAIRDRLAEADPGNAEWQHDLSVSHERIGNVQQAQGETNQAIAAFGRALDIYREAQRRNPDDVQARLFSVVGTSNNRIVASVVPQPHEAWLFRRGTRGNFAADAAPSARPGHLRCVRGMPGAGPSRRPARYAGCAAMRSSF